MPDAQLNHTVATLTDGSEVRIPWWRIDSGHDGETLLVIAAQHGNEVQGCEVIRRFKELCESELVAGEVRLVPFANLPAVRHRRSHINLGPEQPYGDHEGHNMNRSWPGDADGNDTERVTHALHEGIVRDCTRALDLHSWSRFTATCTLARDEGLSREMALVSGIRFINWRSLGATGTSVSTIGTLFNDSGRGSITIELAPQWVIRQKEVALGLRAATNLAKLAGMIEGEVEQIDGPYVEFGRDSEADAARKHPLHAPCSGLFVEAGLETSDHVTEGLCIGHIIRDDNLETVEVISPADGWLYQFGCYRPDCDVALPPQHPYASEGDALAFVMEE